jgi:hypothetical protein
MLGIFWKGRMMINENEIAEKIENLLKGSSGFIVEIGKELSIEKEYWRSAGDIKPYASLYTKLSFGMKVGEKYIAISKDELLVKHLEHCPASYHAIYDHLLKSKIEAITGLPAADVWAEIIKKTPYANSPSVKIQSPGITPSSSRKDIKTLLDEIAEKAGQKTKGIYGGGLRELPTLVVVPIQPKDGVAVMSINLPQNILSSKKAELEEFQQEVKALWKKTMKMSPKYLEFPSAPSAVPDKNEEAA